DDARTLLSRDERAIRQLLERQLKTDGLPPNLIPLVIALLAERALARIALAVLQKHTTGREGVLVDALLDQREPDVVRRRIPRILRSLGTERARDGLLAGLDDPNFGVRYYCAQSLFRIVS